MTYPHGEPGAVLTLQQEQQERARAAYPEWVCCECGRKHGTRIPTMATFHNGTCGVCGKASQVTEPRDYGHLKPGWADHLSD